MNEDNGHCGWNNKSDLYILPLWQWLSTYKIKVLLLPFFQLAETSSIMVCCASVLCKFQEKLFCVCYTQSLLYVSRPYILAHLFFANDDILGVWSKPIWVNFFWMSSINYSMQSLLWLFISAFFMPFAISSGEECSLILMLLKLTMAMVGDNASFILQSVDTDGTLYKSSFQNH